MNLVNGLDNYKADSEWWNLTLTIERSAVEVVELISRYGDRPNGAALGAARFLLIKIEEWKAMCLKDQMVNAEKNSEEAVWDAFRGALSASNDLEAILSIMQLKGFGSSHDFSDEGGGRKAAHVSAIDS